MPWEFLASYGAKKALDKLIFTERNANRLMQLVKKKGFAERFLDMEARELAYFYRGNSLVDVELGGKLYALPMVSGLEVSDTVSFTCDLNSQLFRVSNTLDSYTSPVRALISKNKVSFDGRVVRLDSIENHRIHLRKASYYDGVSTNFAMDFKPNNRKETLREYVHGREHKLKPFSVSQLVNHIGVVCMVESADGLLVVQRRGKDVTNRSRTLSSSVSGAANWTDLENMSVPFSFNQIANSAKREALEELNVEPEKVTFLGLVRELLRGGKPELYYYAKSQKSFEEISIHFEDAEGKKETKELLSYEYHSDRLNKSTLERDRFKDRVKEVLHAVESKANLTLIAGIVLSTRYFLDQDQ